MTVVHLEAHGSLCDVYEDAFHEAVKAEVARMCRATLDAVTA